MKICRAELVPRQEDFSAELHGRGVDLDPHPDRGAAILSNFLLLRDAATARTSAFDYFGCALRFVVVLPNLFLSLSLRRMRKTVVDVTVGNVDGGKAGNLLESQQLFSHTVV